MDRGAWWATVSGVTKHSDPTEQLTLSFILVSVCISLVVKNLPANRRHKRPEKIHWRREWLPTPVFSTGKIPWTKEPGGLQSLVSQRVRHDWVAHMFPFPDDIPCWASFHMITCHLYISSGGLSVRSLTHFFFLGGWLFSYCWVLRVLLISWITVLYEMFFAKIFFQSEVCLSFLKVVFHRAKANTTLMLMKSNWSICHSWIVPFILYLKSYCHA